jgi:hypothetical protein
MASRLRGNDGTGLDRITTMAGFLNELNTCYWEIIELSWFHPVLF